MRTANVNILGEAHLLCLSTRAKLEIDEEFGSMERAFEQLQGDDNRVLLKTTFTLLEIMMRAGEVYARHTGERTAKPLTADELFDLVAFAELPDLVSSLRDAIVNGAKREVEVELPKNAGATPSGA